MPRNAIESHICLLTLIASAVVTVAACGESGMDEGRSGNGVAGTGGTGTGGTGTGGTGTGGTGSGGTGGTGSGGTIGVEPIDCTKVDCNDLNECTIDACEPGDGTCSHLPANDDTACAFAPGVAGLCRTGACEDAMLCVNVVCDDFNACTRDACDPASGLCSNPSESDATPCNFGGEPGICQSGVCEDAMLCATVNCDDGEQCTEDSCDRASGACDNVPVADDSTCTFSAGVAGLCSAGVCEDAMLCAGIACDDGNQCTSDSCDPAHGMCTFATVTNGSACDFAPGIGGTCTAGFCEDAMLCAGVDCGDGNECTEDACDPSDGACVQTRVTDGQLCDSAASMCRNGFCAYRAWRSREILSTYNGYNAHAPKIGVGADGSAIAAWGQDEFDQDIGMRMNVWASRYTKTGGWEAPELIETNDSGNAYITEIAVDASGNAIAVWTHLHENGVDSSIWANRFTPGGGWEAAQSIQSSPDKALSPHIAFDPNGNAISIWEQIDGGRYSIWANRFTPGGGWGTAIPIETSDTGDAHGENLAVNQNGDAIAVWGEGDGTLEQLWANRYTPTGGWGTPEVIETNDADRNVGPRVALDANGNAIVVWTTIDATSRFSVWANRFTPTGGWETPQLLDANDTSAPQIAMAPVGTAVVAWKHQREFNGSPFHSLRATQYSPTSGWEPAQLVGNQKTGNPAVAIDSNGNSFITAARTTYGGLNTIVGARRTAVHAWWTDVNIADEGSGFAAAAQIGVDSSGNAIAVWTQEDRSRARIWTNRFQ